MNCDGFLEYELQESPSSPLLPSLSSRTHSSATAFMDSLRPIEIYKNYSQKLPHIKLSPCGSPKYSDLITKKLKKLRSGTTKVAANTTIGLSKFKNEDRVRVIINIKKPLALNQEKWPLSSFYGIYNGYGGKECSEFLKDRLHDYIFMDDNFPFRPKKAIECAFIQADQDYLNSAEENNDLSGAGALICLFIGKKCFIGNCGDSRAILSIGHGTKILQLTNDHTPLNSSEVNRIISSGGKLVSNFILHQGIRIDKGSNRILPGNLLVSRGFGDFPAKFEKFGGNPNVLIVNPDLKSFSILNEYDFIIICSVGVLHKLSNKEIIDSFWRGIDTCMINTIEEKVKAGIEEVINEAKYRRSEENLTVMLIGFNSLETICGI